MSTKIEIPFSKTKTALPIIFLLFLGATGIYAYISPESFVSSAHENPEKTRLMGIAAGGIGLVLAIIFIRKWFINKTGLIIDENGITDVSNASYTELIEWNDITGIRRTKNGPIKSIVLLTDKPQKYLDKAKKTSRYTMQKVLRAHGSPFLLVSSRLKIKYDDLADLISTEFEKAKQTPSSH